MLPQDIIAAKRDGKRLSSGQVAAFVEALTDNSWSEGQFAALAMAILLRGMEPEERAELTQRMAQSGETIDWSARGIDGPILDKHSNGGVGDKVSFIVAPLVAALGGTMPKMSGRGLGHTGGTIDKLSAIEGFDLAPSPKKFTEVVKSVGFALTGQSAQLAPADKRLYAIRDVTGTVPSADLIASSILSKKLATNPDCLVLDVKVGNGAFLQSLEEARALAEIMVEIATASGVKTNAVLTDMDQVLSRSVGNASEVREAIAFLKGDTSPAIGRLGLVSFALTERLLDLSGLDAADAMGAKQAIADGRAAEKFGAMVAALGGPSDLIENPEKHLTIAPDTAVLTADRGGYLNVQNCVGIGQTLVQLGGGRTRAGEPIDTAVAIEIEAMVGDEIQPGQPLATVHARSALAAEDAIAQLKGCFTLGDSPPEARPAIIGVVD